MNGTLPASSASPSIPSEDLLRGWAPLQAGDPPSLLERGSTYLPFEREMRERWSSWLLAFRRTPPEGPVPGDLVAVLREVPSPGGLFRALHRRPTFRAYPVPGRPIEGPRVVLEDPDDRAREGGCYRLARGRRRLFAWRGPEGVLGTEEVLWVDGLERVPESEFFPPLPRGPTGAEATVREFSDATGLDRSVAPLLLLPFVGSPPWHGRPPGVDVVMGSWGAPSALLAGAARPLRRLLPPWCVPLSRVRGRERREAGGPSFSTPYSVQLDPLSNRSWERLQGKGTIYESSFLLFGGPDASELSRVLFDAHLPLFDPPDRWQDLAATHWDDEGPGRWADHLVRVHFQDPMVPEGDELHRGLERGLGRIRSALGEVPRLLGLPEQEFQRFLLDSRPLRDHLVQAAISRARVLGRTTMLGEDLAAISDRFVLAVEDPALGSSRNTRALLSLGGRLRSRREQVRFFVLRSILMERPDSSVRELWSRVHRKDLWSSLESFEDYLLRRAAEGVLASLRPETYRWEGV